jgi:hypothetical protein
MSIICNKKGIIFFTDAIISSAIMLVIILVFVFFITNKINILVQEEKHFFLEEKTIFLADSFVKNFDSENAMLGACKIDLKKKRILSNEIDSLNFGNIKAKHFDNFFIKEIIIDFFYEKRERIFFDSFEGKECFSVRRFAFVDNKKAGIEFKGCLK